MTTTQAAQAPQGQGPQAQGYAPGMRVRARDEEWLVREVQPMGGGHKALRCVGTTELVRGHETILLTSLETDIRPVRVEETGLVVDDTQAYRKSRLFIESLLRRSPPTDSHLYVGQNAALRPSNYQLRPAEDALKALRPRILIADGVGLGKTLEVGVLLSELILRGRGDRILVVVMKSMLAQFQRELWTRFTIPLVRLDSEGIQRVRSRIPTGKNPFHTFKRAIISIDTLKNERQYRPWLEEARWDAVVIDECHNAINIGTGRHRVASLLARTTDALILASATPHNGRPESFANLMAMLEPTAIANPLQYTKDDIKGLYRRRFKRDIEHEVKETFPERDPQLVWADANASEEAVFSAIHAATFRTLDRTTKTKGGRMRDVLFKTVLLKGFLSSPQAFVLTCDERLKHIDERLAKAAATAGQTSMLGRDLEEDRATLLNLRDLALRIGAPTKMEKLFTEVLPALGLKGDAKRDPRVVIFSERRATIEALEHQFATRWNFHTHPDKPGDGHVAVLTGSETDTRIQEVLESFSSKDGAVKVLLASDMASEGINLHHTCSRLVHFDVPWSLIRLEQRSGRIDRYGQQEVPRIRYLLNRTETAARSDVHVVETLIEKEKAARENLGDVGALMGLHDPEAEEEHIAAGISANESFDDVVKEVADAAAVVGDDDDVVDGADFLAALFGGEPDAAQEPPPPTATRPSLYSDDLAFFTDALSEVEPALVEEAEGPFRLELRAHPDRPELTLRVPADLKRRFEDLPPEARPQHETLWLSTDRDAVMDAIAKSRDHHGAWPDLQLLWPLHPALSWAADRVLVSFGRHEAPIVVAPGLAGDAAAEDDGDDEWRSGHDAIALFEGTVSNKLGQPLIVDWFGLPTRLSATGAAAVGAPLALDEVVRLTGFSARLPNPGPSRLPKASLEAARPAWATAAQARMQRLRTDRSLSLGDTVRDGERRASQWHGRMRETLDTRQTEVRAKLAGRRQAAALQQLGYEATEVDKVRQSRVDWLKKRFTSDGTPWLRLVAVFVAR